LWFDLARKITCSDLSMDSIQNIVKNTHKWLNNLHTKHEIQKYKDSGNTQIQKLYKIFNHTLFYKHDSFLTWKIC
jgi:hypothetical protein